MKMEKSRIFRRANNDGTGREDWHVEIDGTVWGPYRTKQEAEKIADTKLDELFSFMAACGAHPYD